jgi:hypothetical protein
MHTAPRISGVLLMTKRAFQVKSSMLSTNYIQQQRMELSGFGILLRLGFLGTLLEAPILVTTTGKE